VTDILMKQTQRNRFKWGTAI